MWGDVHCRERVPGQGDGVSEKPEYCSHCLTEEVPLTNYTKTYGPTSHKPHWLCAFCEITLSANRLGCGSEPDGTVQDVAAMLNLLAKRLGISEKGNPNEEDTDAVPT
jgi:hypothetical protein